MAFCHHIQFVVLTYQSKGKPLSPDWSFNFSAHTQPLNMFYRLLVGWFVLFALFSPVS